MHPALVISGQGTIRLISRSKLKGQSAHQDYWGIHMEIRVIPLTGQLVKQEIQMNLLRQQLDLTENAVLTLYDSIAKVSPSSISQGGDVYIPSGQRSASTATYSP